MGYLSFSKKLIKILLPCFIYIFMSQIIIAEPIGKGSCEPFNIIDINIVFPAAECGGILYLAKQDGLYRYSKNSLIRLYKGSPNYVSISRDGKLLAFSEGGSIKIYNLGSGEVEEILKGDYKEVFYEQPTWLPKDKGLLYTKKFLDISSKASDLLKAFVYTIDLKTKEQRKLTEGSSASFVENKGGIVFQRDNSIIYKSLKDNSESIVDEGMLPRSSPDGKYIAYVKVNTAITEIKSRVFIEENLHHIWIMSTGDFSTKKRITCNYPLKLIDEETWLKKLKPSKEIQILSYSGRYCYLYPTWTSDSNNIYAIVRVYPYANERLISYLIRIPL